MTERHVEERQHIADVIRSERLQRGWSVGEAAEQMDVYGSAAERAYMRDAAKRRRRVTP